LDTTECHMRLRIAAALRYPGPAMQPPRGAISARVARLRSGDDPELLARMPSGYAVLGQYQPGQIRGCCMLLPHEVVASPNDLAPADRARFFGDLVLLGDAILRVTGAERINYLVLCNQAPELHGHCIPRFASEDPALRLQGPFEAYDFAASPVADARGADQELARDLQEALGQLLGVDPGRR
jgi:diadenosine tetraphosphate (Ap4A) HIT family hydrolase